MLGTNRVKGRDAKRPAARKPVQLTAESEITVTDGGCTCTECYRCREGAGHCRVEADGCRINPHPDLTRFNRR